MLRFLDAAWQILFSNLTMFVRLYTIVAKLGQRACASRSRDSSTAAAGNVGIYFIRFVAKKQSGPKPG